jgi:Rrf2 family protein
MQSIIRLSEATAIALHSMIYIDKKGEETSSVKEIAAEFGISENHLSKVLQRLVKAGYLNSTKGPKGGFTITKEHKDASFLEIYKIIEGDLPITNCIFNRKPCGGSACIMHNFVGKINKEFIEYFTNTKISDF